MIRYRPPGTIHGADGVERPIGWLYAVDVSDGYNGDLLDLYGVDRHDPDAIRAAERAWWSDSPFIDEATVYHGLDEAAEVARSMNDRWPEATVIEIATDASGQHTEQTATDGVPLDFSHGTRPNVPIRATVVWTALKDTAQDLDAANKHLDATTPPVDGDPAPPPDVGAQLDPDLDLDPGLGPD